MATNANTERVERLKRKYGAAIIDNGLRLRPDDFLDEVEWRDRIDQHYTRAWLEFTYGGLFTRKGLDEQRWAIRFTPRRRDSVWSAATSRTTGSCFCASRAFRSACIRDTSRTRASVATKDNASLSGSCWPPTCSSVRTNHMAWRSGSSISKARSIAALRAASRARVFVPAHLAARFRTRFATARLL